MFFIDKSGDEAFTFAILYLFLMHNSLIKILKATLSREKKLYRLVVVYNTCCNLGK